MREHQSDRPGPPESRAPAAGTFGLLKDTGREILEDDIPGQAAKLAYYAFLSLPPAIMAIFGIAGLVGSERLAMWIDGQARLAMPPEVVDTIISPFIQEVVLQNAPGPLSIGIVLAVYGASAVFAGLMTGLNHAFDLAEQRGFLKRKALAFGVMVVGVILFILAAGLLLVGPRIVDAIGLGRAGTTAWNILHWPIAFAMIVAAFWFCYYVLPNRDNEGDAKTLLIPAAAGAAFWLLATAGFRLYIENFGSYGETYGFLGAFIILLLWLYMTSFVVLAGGELASEMAKRKRAERGT